MAGFFDRLFGPELPERPLERHMVEEARTQVRAGRKIQAVKTVRERTGMGLAEAKHIVDDIEAGRSVPTVPTPGESLADRSRELLAQDRVADALVMVSGETGMTENEATRFLDALDR